MRVETALDQREENQVARQIKLREDAFDQGLVVIETGEPLLEPVADGDIEESDMTFYFVIQVGGDVED